MNLSPDYEFFDSFSDVERRTMGKYVLGSGELVRNKKRDGTKLKYKSIRNPHVQKLAQPVEIRGVFSCL